MTERAQPEQQFFPDAAVDRLMGIVFNLTAEVQVLRERLHVLEHLLESRGVVQRAAIDGFSGDEATEHALSDDRREYVQHVLGAVLGRAASRNDVEASRVG